jgi:hypothetical protein
MSVAAGRTDSQMWAAREPNRKSRFMVTSHFGYFDKRHTKGFHVHALFRTPTSYQSNLTSRALAPIAVSRRQPVRRRLRPASSTAAAGDLHTPRNSNSISTPTARL